MKDYIKGNIMRRFIFLFLMSSGLLYSMTYQEKNHVIKLMKNGCINDQSAQYCSCQEGFFQDQVPLNDFDELARGYVVLSKKPGLAQGAPKKVLYYINSLNYKCGKYLRK